MEEDIIDQLYFGRIVPWERQVEKPPEIEKYSDQICEDIEYLQKLLDDGTIDALIEQHMSASAGA